MFNCFKKKKCDARDKSTSSAIVYYLNCFCEWCEKNYNIVKYTPISVQVDNELLITENKKLKEENQQLKHDIEQLNQSKLYSTKEWNDLRDENEKLKADNNELKKCYENFIYGDNGLVEDMCKCEKENRQLKAENEVLESLKKQLTQSIETIGFSNNPHKEACKERLEQLKAEIRYLESRDKSLSKMLLVRDEQIKQLKAQLEKLKTPYSIKVTTQYCPLTHTVEEFYKCEVCSPNKPQEEQCEVSGAKLDKIDHYAHNLREAYECIICNPERKPHKSMTEEEQILKFCLGDRVAVHREGRDTFRGTIFNMYNNKIYVIEDGFYSAHDENPFLPSECRKLRKVKRKPHRCPICFGFGSYPSLVAQEVASCHACNNTGIVWESR